MAKSKATRLRRAPLSNPLAAMAAFATTSSSPRTASKQSLTKSYQQPSTRAYTTWTPARLRSVEFQSDGGYMFALADLVDQLLAQSRIRKAYETVIGGLLSLPIGFEASGDGRRRGRAVKALEADEDWWEAFPEAELQNFLTAGRIAGVAFAQLVWTKVGTRLIPKLDPWSLAHFRFDWTLRQWFARTQDGSEVDVNPGDGRWIAYMPYGSYRPWAFGQWRGLSPWWLLERYAISDWGRTGAVGASYVATPRINEVADETIKDQRRQLSDHLYQLSQEGGVIVLPNGFDLDVVQLTANTARTYQEQINTANTAIDIAIQGQNLTSEVKAGSHAAAGVHERVEDRIIRNIGSTAATALHDQALTKWAQFNFGDESIAPWPVWDTAPPDDTKAEADSQKALGDALDSLQKAGYDVLNVDELADKHGLKLKKSEKPAVPAPIAGAVPGAPPVPPTPSGDNQPTPPVPPAKNARMRTAAMDIEGGKGPRYPIGPGAKPLPRLVLVGGPRTGKSTLARDLRESGVPTFCGDPQSKAKDAEADVTYLPEGIPIAGADGAAQWIVDNWMTKSGPWVLEGWVMARVLRRWMAASPDGKPCDAVLALDHPRTELSRGQVTMSKGVATVWAEIEPQLRARGVEILSTPTALGRIAVAEQFDGSELSDPAED